MHDGNAESNLINVQHKKLAMRVSVITMIVNIALLAAKLAIGIVASSGAMISDAIHSASDVFSTVIVMVGIQISSKGPDKKHQYGHERLECVASIILALILLETGVAIGVNGLQTIFSGHYEDLVVPGKSALVIALMSVIVEEWMFWYTRSAAKKVNSGALMADAWHHRSDALSSVGAFIGIGGAIMGYPVMDSVASVVICLFILKAAIDVFLDAINKMVDKSCDDETVLKIRRVVEAQDGVIEIDSLQTRLFGNKIYVDIEICVDGNKTLKQSHEIAENVHLSIENEFASVKHCMVHVNPYEREPQV